MDFEPSFVRYLAAKQTVDDRALNRVVWDTLGKALPAQTAARPLRVLEVGAGIGTMIERLVRREVLRHVVYTAIDADANNIAELKRRWVAWQASTPGVVVEAEALDVFELTARPTVRGKWDVLIAHAFLDLLNLPQALPQLLAVLRSGGLFYFTLNFDGATILQPEIDPAFDAEIEQLYHQTMDERLTYGEPSGDSHTGRHLFHLLRRAGVEILEAGSSDWVVYADRAGYRNDEAYFLHFIIDTIQRALSAHPALVDQQAAFQAWIDRRHRQIEEGTLVYLAHQIDLVGRITEA